jgi:hypothetical protein
LHYRLTQNHDGGYEDAWSQPLEQDIGKGLEQRIAHEEDGERSIVLSVSHFQILLQTIDLGISDIRSVEEGNQVEERKPWDEFEVELPEKCFVLSRRLALGECQ